MGTDTTAARRSPWPVLALLLNAFTWGISWWPFRQLSAIGLHPLWATALIYGVSVLLITVWRPAAWGELMRTPTLWVLVLASGTTNVAFNWGVTVGDVVRIVLLFYLMPLWAVLLAGLLLGERVDARGWLRVALALAGALLVLWPPGGLADGVPVPRNLAEWSGVLGGFSFALNNVMLRHEAHRTEAARALAMFSGGAFLSGGLALLLTLGGAVPSPPPVSPGWLAGALLMAAVILAGNAALQYGAARLPAHVTAVVMTAEVLIASVSAVLLGAGELTLPLLLGAALIVGATLLAPRH
jgi:drug/metabolite transporter (DMT)-like permease